MFSGAGLLPLLFVIFFAIVAMIITTGYRDKPWTLLIGSGLVFTLVFFPLLWFLEQINFSSAWTTLTLGWRILVKSKIYATIAEANAPDRGRLFGDFGPFIFLIAVSTALVYFSRALNGRRPVQMAYAIWADHSDGHGVACRSRFTLQCRTRHGCPRCRWIGVPLALQWCGLRAPIHAEERHSNSC